MILKRMITQIRFLLFLGKGRERAKYAKRKGIFGYIGENVGIPIKLPLYPKLIKIHNNVIMHRSVILSTHDNLNIFLSRVLDSSQFNNYQFKHKEVLAPIEIMDNVYVGMNSIILGNVRIGPNVIINAGSVVASDIPPNSVVAGVPAKVVGKFDMYYKTRILKDKGINFEFKRSGREEIDDKTAEKAWALFEKKRNKNSKSVQN